tara:strand:- start:566 stop:1225 length:660 start_codon:yes stop_codon:yes gene_type:complete
MSLFEEAAKAKNPFGMQQESASRGKKVTYINQTSVLTRMLDEFVSAKLLPKDRADQCRGFRTRIGDCHWGLHLLQGKVTEQGWLNIIDASLRGMAKTIKNSQPNGEWEIIDYDVKIEADDQNIEQLFFVVKFVDIENSPDLQYQNGVPVTTTVNVQNTPLPDELVAALTSRPTGDTELKEMISQLVGALTSNVVQSSEVEEDPEPPAQPEGAKPVVFTD